MQKDLSSTAFPRTTAQAESLDSMLSDLNTSIKAMLSLVVNDDELNQKIIGKRQKLWSCR
jgi:adenylate kinase family enzyme